MNFVDWRIRGLGISACNCDWGCPCQFSAAPTRGHCSAAAAIHVERGHFGATILDDLCFGGLFSWPGPIHEGHGEALPLVDARADRAQREAILKIMSGAETEPGATIFNVFAATLDRIREPLFRTFEFRCDMDERLATFQVDGIVSVRVAPIRNPVTREAQRVRVVMPAGFEFTAAEFASGSVETCNGDLPLHWQDRHAHLNVVDLTGQGPVRHAA